MYSVSKDKISAKLNESIDIEGFLMGSKNKVFIIEKKRIKNIIICSRKLAHPLVIDVVLKKYNKLIACLTELLIDDDDTGDAMREALNRIEKFRLEIKVKYRIYLEKKELEFMSKKLIKLQKAANTRLMEIHNSYLEQLSSTRSR